MRSSKTIDPKTDLDIEEIMDDLLLAEGDEFTSPQAVLADHHWEVYADLKMHLYEREWVILPGCALSAFFPPDENCGGGFNTVYLSALIGIGHGQEGQNLEPKLFVMDEKSRQDGSLEFVKTFGIKHLEINSNMSPKDIASHILLIRNKNS